MGSPYNVNQSGWETIYDYDELLRLIDSLRDAGRHYEVSCIKDYDNNMEVWQIIWN